MAGTSIKGMPPVNNTQIPDLAAAAKQNAGTGFQAVWNKTKSVQNAGNSNSTNAAGGHKETVRGDSLRTGDRQRENLAAASDDKDIQAEDTDVKDVEKAQEVLGTVLQNLIGQITDTFSVSEEELQQTMDDLGMSKTDLLDPGKLGELLMTIGGAQDSFALLTDEKLYGDVKGILDLQRDLTKQAQEELQVTPGEWQDMVANASGMTEPVITVDVDENSTDRTVEAPEDVTELTAKQEPKTQTQAVEQKPQEDETKDSESGQETHTAGQQGNLMLQNLKEDSFLSGLQQAAQADETRAADTQDIMRQIMDYMKVSVKADSSDLEMQLHPQSLGTLHVQVASKNGVVTANFITQNEAVKAALESQMVQLKESFAEQGVKVEAIEVTVQTHPFEQNLEQGRGRQNSSETEAGIGRRRARRINLNAAFEENEPQTEEDRIAADIMSANGNTVDFTA